MKNKIRFDLVLVFLLVFSLQSCESKGTGDSDNLWTESKSSKLETLDAANNSVSQSRRNAITEAVKKCSPAIVGINVTSYVEVTRRDPFDVFYDDPMFRHFFGNRGRRTQKYEVQGLGSGFLISPDGYILTNHHVAGNASKIIVTTTDGKKFDAEIVGADKTSDVCLLKIDGKKFQYLELSNSDDVVPGEWAIAFGNPFGLFDLNAHPTVTVGVVSNTGVNLIQEDRVYKGMIQTDAAISSGNSGGPLVNSLGEVIAINTIIFSTAQNQRGAGSIGIGFAIPINRVKEIVAELKDKKTIDRNFYHGMEVREIDEQVQRYLKIEQNEGVIVFSVERNSPANDAKIEPGDIILEINGMKILRQDDFLINVLDARNGQKLNFKLLRDGEEINTTLTLKSRKQR